MGFCLTCKKYATTKSVMIPTTYVTFFNILNVTLPQLIVTISATYIILAFSPDFVSRKNKKIFFLIVMIPATYQPLITTDHLSLDNTPCKYGECPQLKRNNFGNLSYINRFS